MTWTWTNVHSPVRVHVRVRVLVRVRVRVCVRVRVRVRMLVRACTWAHAMLMQQGTVNRHDRHVTRRATDMHGMRAAEHECIQGQNSITQHTTSRRARVRLRRRAMGGRRLERARADRARRLGGADRLLAERQDELEELEDGPVAEQVDLLLRQELGVEPSPRRSCRHAPGRRS